MLAYRLKVLHRIRRRDAAVQCNASGVTAATRGVIYGAELRRTVPHDVSTHRMRCERPFTFTVQCIGIGLSRFRIDFRSLVTSVY